MIQRLLLGFGLTVFAASLCAAKEPERSKPKSLADLDAQLEAIFGEDNIPGASVAVVENGQLVFVKGYGLADRANKTAVTPDTIFRAASISKTFTGIAVMTAVQDGKLQLDARLKELAPEVQFHNPWESTDPVRLVHLLEHTTGWPDISFRVLTTDGPGWSLSKGVRESSSEFVSRYKPGHFAVYNNAGPAVAGLILEKVTGQEFNTYMRERVLRPLGMANADFDQTDEMAAKVAKSYEADGTLSPFQRIILAPAGSLNTSAKELSQIVRFFLGRGTVDGQKILSPESVQRIERAESLLASPQGFADYGYGLGNVPFPDTGITFRGHNGGIDSFSSVFGYSLAANGGYVLLANGGNGVDFSQPAARLIQDYLTRNLKMHPAPTADISQDLLQSYAGFYRAITPSNHFTQPYQEVLGLTWVSAEKGKLVISGNEFFPVNDHVFRRFDRESPTLAFSEAGGGTYKISSFSSAAKEPAWRAYTIMGVLGMLAVGAAIALLMTPVWLFGLVRGRLTERGGALVRFLPVLSVIALVITFAMPFVYLASGSIPSALLLASPGPYSYTIFGASLLFPLFALLGLVRAWSAGDANLFVRLHAGLTSLALLVFAAYAASIGWVGAQTWAM
ncbi:MAG: serine hydrolase domain-containing protein [Micropepsaceae bacterium]